MSRPFRETRQRRRFPVTLRAHEAGMRRFEMVEGSSSKFWEIELGDASFEVRWGRIGTSGQSQTKTFSNAAKARAEHDRLIKDKAGMAGPPEPPKPARTCCCHCRHARRRA